MMEVEIHDEDSSFAKEINKIFPLNKVIRKLNSWDKEDKEHWVLIIISTLLHNTTNSGKEALEIIKKAEKVTRRLK
jgi:hypothetical protein